jgi:SAM-dependent methyltransferase
MQDPEQKTTVWPKVPPALSDEQRTAREKFMQLWHEILPRKYAIIEKFNHNYVVKLPHKIGSKTLEIGAGLGEHLKHENLDTQDYYCLEYRESFCEQIKPLLPPDRVTCGDIQKKQKWDAGTFDRVIAIHVLEHLNNLPAALEEVSRLLKKDGFFDVVIPCEGGFSYSLARKISAERVFVKNFKMDYAPIIKSEHINTYGEVLALLLEHFSVKKISHFPFRFPIATFNLVVGFRLTKKL